MEDKNDAIAVTRKDVLAARNEEEIRVIRRRARIEAWSDYLEFFVAKTIGVIGIVVGGLEYLAPEILPITLTDPKAILGSGLALVLGRGVLTLLAKAEKVFGGKQ